MLDRTNHTVPQNLDAPVKILFWEPMEFVLAITAVGFGVMLKQLLFGIFLAGLVLWGSKKLKRGSKRGAMPHHIWFGGLELDPAMKAWFPASWRNDFLE